MSIQNSPGNYLAFHKGALVSDYILNYIINAAMRGLMTATGKRLLLIPDVRKGPADILGLRLIGKFNKSDCTTLKQLIRKIRKARLCQNRQKTAK